MRIPIKRLILSPAAMPYLGFAEREVYELHSFASLTNNFPMGRTYVVDGIFIKISCSEDSGKIIMWSKTQFPHMLFSAVGALKSLSYNYVDDKFLDASTNYSGVLHSGFLGRCQFSEAGHNTYLNKWTAAIIPPPERDYGLVNPVPTYIGTVAGHNAIIYGNMIDLVAYNSTTTAVVAKIGFDPVFSFTDYHSVVAAVQQDGITSGWSKLYPYHFMQRLLGTNTMNDIFAWYPSFYFKEEGNEETEVGWFYGKENSWNEGDPFTPLAEDSSGVCGKAVLRAMLNVHAHDLAYNFGYCEELTEVSGSSPSGGPVLSFFFSSTVLNTDEGDRWFGWRVYTTYADAEMRGGTKPTGQVRAAVLRNPFNDGQSVDEVKMWSFKGYSGSCVGIFVRHLNKAKFYKYNGGSLITDSQLIFETTNYHSHSVSSEGDMLSVFKGSGYITSFDILDLYGTRNVVLKDYSVLRRSTETYSGGGFTVVRSNVLPTQEQTITGCFVPHLRPGQERTFDEAYIYPYTTYPTAPTGLFGPAMGSLHWPRDGNGALTIYKMKIMGEAGEVIKIVDECFQSTIIIDQPGKYNDTVVAEWGSPGTVDLYSGLIRGVFTDGGLFQGVGDGDIAVVTLPEHFLFIESATSPFYYAENNVGEIDVIEGTAPAQTCEDQEYDKFTATDQCGRTETIVDTVPASTAIPTITTPSNGSLVGTSTNIVISGGMQPYSVSFSIGTLTNVNATTWQIATVENCNSTGQVRWGSIEVTDACGKVDSHDVRVTASGAWACASDHTDFRIYTNCPDAAFPNPDNGGSCYVQSDAGTNSYTIGGYRYYDLWYCFVGSYYPRCCNDLGPSLNGFQSTQCATGTACIEQRYKQEWVCT